MGQILDYLATDIVTSYENNIKQRYVTYVERFVNVLYRKKENKNSLSKEGEFSAFVNHLRKVKTDILNKTQMNEAMVQPHLQHIIPQREFKKDKDGQDTSVMYDIECRPQDYLP